MEKEKNQGFQLEQLGRESPFTELGNPGGRIHLRRKTRHSDLLTLYQR